jgi:hypothetical protein
MLEVEQQKKFLSTRCLFQDLRQSRRDSTLEFTALMLFE